MYSDISSFFISKLSNNISLQLFHLKFTFGIFNILLLTVLCNKSYITDTIILLGIAKHTFCTLIPSIAAEFIPITFPFLLNKGPPLLPAFIGASICK